MLNASSFHHASERTEPLYEMTATGDGVRLAPCCQRGHEMVIELMQRLGLFQSARSHRHAVAYPPAPAPEDVDDSARPCPAPPLPLPEETSAKATQEPTANDEPSHSLSELTRLHLGNMERGKDPNRSAVRERRYILTLLKDVIGDKPIGSITVDDASAFADLLSVWPAYLHNNPDLKHMPPLAIAARAKQLRLRAITLPTQGKHILSVKAFFHWCVESGAIAEDPFRFIQMSRYHDAVPRKKEVFTPQDLQVLFDPNRLRMHTEPHKYWVPLIALYTGMRVNEISQLYLEDLKTETIIDESGAMQTMLCFDITPFRKGQRLKTPHSKRRIPVHSTLLNLGFEDYVEDVRKSGADHLFPGLTWGCDGPGRVMTQWFNGPHLRKVCSITARSKTFHCFRHTITTLADRCLTPKSIMRTLNGHSDGRDVENQSYVARGTLLECKRTLEKLPFPQLDLVPYASERFAAYLKHAAEQEQHKERMGAEGKSVSPRKGRPRRLTTSDATGADDAPRARRTRHRQAAA